MARADPGPGTAPGCFCYGQCPTGKPPIQPSIAIDFHSHRDTVEPPLPLHPHCTQPNAEQHVFEIQPSQFPTAKDKTAYMIALLTGIHGSIMAASSGWYDQALQDTYV